MTAYPVTYSMIVDCAGVGRHN